MNDVELMLKIRKSLSDAGLVHPAAALSVVVDTVEDLVSPITAFNDAQDDIKTLRAENESLSAREAELRKQLSAANDRLAAERRARKAEEPHYDRRMAAIRKNQQAIFGRAFC